MRARARRPSQCGIGRCALNLKRGSQAKKPPLTQCSERGFSRNPATRPPPSITATPKGSAGRTTVIVATARCSAWVRASAARSTSATPSP
jgi:hypothetical protein